MTVRTESTTRSDPKKVKVGSVFSRHSFGAVVGIEPYRNAARLRNESGFEWEIGLNILEQECAFADQFDTEQRVSRTRAIEILTENAHTAMTVHFNKAVDTKDVADKLDRGRDMRDQRHWVAYVKDALAGEERVMVGKHANVFDEHRRLKFHEHGTGQRLVDPRTVNFIVVNRVKYTVE